MTRESSFFNRQKKKRNYLLKRLLTHMGQNLFCGHGTESQLQLFASAATVLHMKKHFYNEAILP